MFNSLYPRFNNRYFEICPGCVGIPLLSIEQERHDDLCEFCKHDLDKVLIKKWESEAELAKFPKEIGARKNLSFERRVTIANLLTILSRLKERKSENGYKAEKSLHFERAGRRK